MLKDKKKVFTMDGLDYEAEVGALHPGGTTAAVGGTVSGSYNFRTQKISPSMSFVSFALSQKMLLISERNWHQCVCK